jgi:hypothetical protein
MVHKTHKPLCVSFLTVLALVLFPALALACGGDPDPHAPRDILDTAYRDLTAKVGQTLTRRLIPYSWAEDVFVDTSYGCPAAGATYEKTRTRGYRINIFFNKVTYRYHASLSGHILFDCTNGTPGPNIPVVPDQIPTQAANQEQDVPQATPKPTRIPPGYFDGPLAYVAPDGNVYVTVLEGGSTFSITGNNQRRSSDLGDDRTGFSSLRWSQDGTFLAFVNAKAAELYLFRNYDASAQVIKKALDPEYPYIAYAPDPEKSQLAYIARDPEKPNFHRVMIVGYPDDLWTATFISACPPKPSPTDLADHLYRTEMGILPNERPFTFEWITLGFLFSPDCTSLELMTAKGKTLWRKDGIIGAMLSPDGTRAVAYKTDPATPDKAAQLVLLDLATGNDTPLAVPMLPQRMAWTPAGDAIVYNTLTPGERVSGDPNDVKGKELFGSTWIQSPAAAENTITLWKLPIGGGEPTKLFEHKGYAVGSLMTTARGGVALVSLVTSAADVVRKLNAKVPSGELWGVVPRTELISIPLDGGAPQWIALGGQAALSTGEVVYDVFSYRGEIPSVSPVDVTCPKTKPSRLTVGIRAQVKAGAKVNFRESPTKGKVIEKLTEGATFLPLDQPTCGQEDGITWWKVNYNGKIGYVAEGHNDFYWLKPMKNGQQKDAGR